MARPRKPKIRAAVGTSSSSFHPDRKNAAKLIELAMAEAVKQCLAEGISLEDSATIKSRMMEAREAMKEALGLTS